jgi:hypothetical protein
MRPPEQFNVNGLMTRRKRKFVQSYLTFPTMGISIGWWRKETI